MKEISPQLRTLIGNVFVLCIFVLKTPEKAPPASRIEMFLFVSKQKGLQVKTMLKHNLFRPFFL